MLAITYYSGEQFVELLKVLALCAALVATVTFAAMVAACISVLVCAINAALLVGLFAAIAVGPRVIGRIEWQ